MDGPPWSVRGIEMDIGGFLFGLFEGFGDVGITVCIFLLFFIDALLFPTLPEVFFILGFGQNPTIPFGIVLLASAALAEQIGIFLLYYIVKKIRIPGRIAKVADKYINFLIVSDERALLVNRVAPTIPFAGAFIALVDSWEPKKCSFYIFIGCILKYGAIMLFSSYAFEFFSTDMAQDVTLITVIAVLVISLLAGYIKKRKSGLDDEEKEE